MLTASANPNQLVPAKDNKKVAVTVSGQVTDIGMGVQRDSGTYTVQDSFDSVEPGGAFEIAADGSFSFVLQLSADLKDKKEDEVSLRLYTITLKALDKAGNQGSAMVLVKVTL